MISMSFSYPPTHILQPLDVGCFGLLQTTYERYLREWLRETPVLVLRKVGFLVLLFRVRSDVYTIDIVTKAWKNTGR